MRARTLLKASAAVLGLTLAASACQAPGANDDGNSGGKTSLTVGWNQVFYSGNTMTSNGNNSSNANVAYLTQGNFNYYDANSNLVKDEGFGTYTKVSDNPLTIKYTVGKDTVWSDGTPVDGVDLMLYWAASSGKFNTIDPSKVERNDDSEPTNTKGKVFFDAAGYSPGTSWSLVTKMPKLSDGGKSVTFVYDKPYADWELDFTNAGTILPAHIVAEHALGLTDATAAKDALLKALAANDSAKLVKVANFWNTGFDMSSMPKDTSLLVGSGAYIISAFKENEYVTLTKNPKYHGDRPASIDELTIRYSEKPTVQLQALRNGELSMFYPQVTEDVITDARKINGVKIDAGTEGSVEHLDLTLNNGGPFDPKSYGGDAAKAKKVRQAFLLALPRQEVVDKLIKPIDPSAVVRQSFLQAPAFPDYASVVAANGSNAYARQDITQAKKLLSEAGVKAPVKVRVMYADANARRADEFKIYQPELAKAGFQLVDGKDAKWSEKLGSKSYDAVYFAWQSVTTSVLDSMATYTSDGGQNFQGYGNPEVDRLFKQVAFTSGDKRLELVKQIDKLMMSDAISLPVFQFPAATIYDSRDIEGVDTAVLSPTMFYGYWDWKLK